jgi:DinB family protein
MEEEFVDRDLSGVRMRDVNLTGARMHGLMMADVKITNAFLRNADIDGYIGGLKVNGVEVAPLIDAELNRRHPERAKLKPTDPAGARQAWEVVETMWAATVERARLLPEHALHEHVDGEFSFTETLRHLIYATDAWIYRVIFGEPMPFHPWGVPPDGPPTKPMFAAWGIEVDADPTLDEVLEVRADRMTRVKDYLQDATAAELARTAVAADEIGWPLGEHQALSCLHVIFGEEWAHHQYATRDLAIIEAR